MEKTLSLCCELIRRESVTPEDAGCQALMMAHLDSLGFACSELPFGEVSNFWAERGTDGPILVFAGHTDVVPTGPPERWATPPFEPTLRDGKLFGRGAADMKASLAAMLVACEEFVAAHPEHPGRIGFLITSDEEGPAADGTVRVVQHLQDQGKAIDWCLVGEPSSSSALGDVIKNGRRGSLGAVLTKAYRATSPTRTWRITLFTAPFRRYTHWPAKPGTRAMSFSRLRPCRFPTSTAAQELPT